MKRPAITVLPVVIVDPHSIVRTGLRSLFHGSPFRIAGEAATATEAMVAALALKPPLLLVSLSVAGSFELITTIRLAPNNPGVAVLSEHTDWPTVSAAIAAGAHAFLLKTAPAEEILTGLSAIAAVRPAAPYLSKHLPEETRELIATGGHHAFAGATARELEVLRLIMDGRTSREIGWALSLQESTIRGYRRDLMDKAGVSNAGSLIRAAHEAGM